MEVRELIEKLKGLPQDLPIRTFNMHKDDDMENEWVVEIEQENEGSDYHAVILLTSE